MTVCVAAIAGSLVIGASDRMLSNNEIAFEPQSRKVWPITSAVFAMWAGDGTVHAEILSAVDADVKSILEGDDPPWFKVSEVADLYVAHWNRVRRKRAEAALLSPLNMDLEGFLARQGSLDPGVADRLTNALIQYQIPRTECIIAGLDESGPHIWVIEDGAARCDDMAGFSVIGAGARHASSQMMIGQHTPWKSPTETLVLVHLAKKRAEVAPSVGEATDIFLLGPKLGQNDFLSDEYQAQLNRDFRSLQRAEGRAFSKAQEGFGAYISARVTPTSAELTQEAGED